MKLLCSCAGVFENVYVVVLYPRRKLMKEIMTQFMVLKYSYRETIDRWQPKEAKNEGRI